MKILLASSALVVALSVTTPSNSATTLTLPADVVAGLTAASSPTDVASVIRTSAANLIATIFSQSNALGVASPPQVLPELIDLTTPLGTIRDLVCAAAEAVPGQADISSAAAYTAAGRNDPGLADAIATCAVDGIEAAGLTEDEVRVEAVEIAAALRDLVPADQQDLAAGSVANATNSGTDDGETIASLANALSQTAVGDIGPNPAAAPQTFFNAPIFVDLPSAAQNNPAGNTPAGASSAPPNTPGLGTSPL